MISLPTGPLQQSKSRDSHTFSQDELQEWLYRVAGMKGRDAGLALPLS